MGMFDSVYVRCPDCGTSIEFQSKSGDCICASYTLDDVPSDVVCGLHGDSEMCPECGREVELEVIAQVIVK
jgi:NMD protein affecting ribosome stability and mRNA decay